MEMAFAAFDQIISILPRSVETYYIFGHWLEEKNLLLSAITQQRTALLIQELSLYTVYFIGGTHWFRVKPH